MIPVKPVPRDAVDNLRRALKFVGMVVAEVDKELRYRWIENPHPDFDPAMVVGKRDDELTTPEDAMAIMLLKRSAFAAGAPMSKTIVFQRADGTRPYTIFAYPIIERTGAIEALFTVGVPVPVKW